MKPLKELSLFINNDNTFEIDWTFSDITYNNDSIRLQEELFEVYNNSPDEFLFKLGFTDRKILLSAGLSFLRQFLYHFVVQIQHQPDIEILRHNINVFPSGKILVKTIEQAPYLVGIEFLTKNWLVSIWKRALNYYKTEIQSYNGKVSDFIKEFSKDAHIAGKVFFHIVENKEGEAPFAFLATYSVTSKNTGETAYLPLKNAFEEYSSNRDKLLNLLSSVNQAAKESNFIHEILETGEILHPLSLSASEALNVLYEIPIYDHCGIVCRIPDWWKSKKSKVSLSLNIGSAQDSILGINSILSFDIKFMLGNHSVSQDEINRILSDNVGLTYIKGNWIEVDKEKIKKMFDAFNSVKKKYKTDSITFFEALRLQLQGIKISNEEEEDIDDYVEISFGEWVENFMNKLRNPDLLEPIAEGSNFKTSLRKYQQKGLNWLHQLYSLNIGGCLADDMGLGKTIQIIALFNYLRETNETNKPNLLIVPASLLSNWKSEIQKFAPDLSYFIAHTSENKLSNNTDNKFIYNYDFIITTYSLTHRYFSLFDIKWNCIILDEAQAIKNSKTRQTKTIKKLNALRKFVLTGTPIENRLSDLWSLFDFINPGLLGSSNEFKSFVLEMQQKAEGYVRLKNIISPFILRRLKTDKSIIKDLPNKIEMKVYADMTKQQVILYSQLVNKLKGLLNESKNNFSRKGLILSFLMKFKQVCNHPDHLTGKNIYNPKESGKFIRIKEICETILEKRERLLVFTQFKEIIHPLKTYLDKIFQHPGLVLHGSTPVRKRKELVNTFQSSQYVPFMILSLKAGGVGLNLTKANHVIHFDRWWNPAVENQATDRAFRIGQTKNVVVHKFITKGAVEEKIDKIIESKTKLANEVISTSNETWITEMSNDELVNLFSLN